MPSRTPMPARQYNRWIIYMEALAVSREYLNMQSSSFSRKFRNDVFICHSSYFFFFKTLQNQLTFIQSQGRKEGGHHSPDAESLSRHRITTGSTEWLRGSQKVQTMSQVFSSIQHICFLMTSNSNMGAPNLLLALGAVWPRCAPIR